MRSPHIPLDLCPGHQRGYRVDHDDVHRTGADQGLGDLQRLLTGIGLRDEQVLHVHTALGGVGGIEGVLHVDEGGDTAAFLGLGDDVLGDGGLASAFGAIYLGDPASGDPSHAEGAVEGQGTGGDDLYLEVSGLSQAHDRTITKALGQACQCHVQCFFTSV